MNQGATIMLLAALALGGCQHGQPPPLVRTVETPVPPPAPATADPALPTVAPNPVATLPPEPVVTPVAREADATVFRADGATRAEALKQVTKAVRRYVQGELDVLARREAAWCRDNVAFAREQLFFSQLSLAPAELGGSVLVEEWLTADTQLAGGHQLVARVPKSLPARLLREHLRGLEAYVATADRAAFRERFPVP